MMSAILTVIPRDDELCWQHSPLDKQYCAKEYFLLKNLCDGDTGSGLVSENYEIIGVLSKINNCSIPGSAIIFADVFKLRSFIASNGNRLSDLLIIFMIFWFCIV